MTQTDNGSISCWVYRSSKKDEMYLYLAEEGDFDDIPEALLSLFGEPFLVMQLELSPKRPLAREDVDKVIGNLKEKRFHLQMPPKLIPEMNDGETI
ncbi:MAG: YcgL domain-containing protein [Gammaproteobacteria bacterium]|nr:YcgL domain-containing protein [Gammaproteobacteria bacterium]